MNKEKQLAILEEKYPLTCTYNSNRRTRHTFFTNIETEIQAYLLGFYASDGNINQERGTLRINLQERDSEIVYLFKDIICPDARTYKRDGVTINGRNSKKYVCQSSFGVDINSFNICKSLVNLGFGYKKTYDDLHLPNLDDDLIRHFIRGYFDGDGTISGAYIKPDPKWKKNENFRSYASICSHTKSLLDEIQQFLARHDIKSTICQDKRDKMWIISVAKLKLPKLFKLLYEDANFYLKRKHDKFYHFVNTEVTQLIAEYRNAQEVNVRDSNNPPTSVEHPTGMKMCAELIGDNKNSEIKSSEDNIIEGLVR